MTDYILLLLGPSGSGKTTAAKLLEEKYGLRQVESYTTRKPRYPGERGHIFVSDAEFNALGPIVACTEFDGARYCATVEQVDSCDIYVIDPAGLKEFRRLYEAGGGTKEPVAVFLDVSEKTCKKRMRQRGDSPEAVRRRVAHDNTVFAGLRETAHRHPDRVLPVDADAVSAEETAEEIYRILQTMRDCGGAEEVNPDDRSV